VEEEALQHGRIPVRSQALGKQSCNFEILCGGPKFQLGKTRRWWWVGPRAGLADFEKRNHLPSLLTVAYSHYRLLYPQVQHATNLWQITHISNLWKIRNFRCNRICRCIYPFWSDQRYLCSKECFQNDRYSPRMAPSFSTTLSTITLPLHFQNTNTNVVLNKSCTFKYLKSKSQVL
jgi:hypothetical protein